jgi:hypothetical protein
MVKRRGFSLLIILIVDEAILSSFKGSVPMKTFAAILIVLFLSFGFSQRYAAFDMSVGIAGVLDYTVTTCPTVLDGYDQSCMGSMQRMPAVQSALNAFVARMTDVHWATPWVLAGGNYMRLFTFNNNLYGFLLADTSAVPASVTPFYTIVFVVQER